MQKLLNYSIVFLLTITVNFIIIYLYHHYHLIPYLNSQSQKYAVYNPETVINSIKKELILSTDDFDKNYNNLMNKIKFYILNNYPNTIVIKSTAVDGGIGKDITDEIIKNLPHQKKG